MKLSKLPGILALAFLPGLPLAARIPHTIKGVATFVEPAQTVSKTVTIIYAR